MTKTLLLEEIDGKINYTPAGLTLLLGITGDKDNVVARSVVDQLRATGDFLPDLRRRLHRRTNEAMAATGSTNPAAALEYWADRNGQRTYFDPHDGTVWLIDDGGPL